VRKIVHLRWKQRLVPVQIGGRLGMPTSTVHAVLTRRLNRLSHIDRITGEPVRRYEHDRPGRRCTSVSPSTAISRMVAAGVMFGRVQGRRHREATARRTGTRGANWATTLDLI
jgi:hypothetical protein